MKYLKKYLPIIYVQSCHRLIARYMSINKPKLTKHICQFKKIRTMNVEKNDQEIFGKQVCYKFKKVK